MFILSIFLLKWQNVLSKSLTQDFNLAVSWCVLAYWTPDNTVSVTDSWHYAGCKSWKNMFSRDVLCRQIKCYAIPSSVTLCGRSQCVLCRMCLSVRLFGRYLPHMLKWNIRCFTWLRANKSFSGKFQRIIVQKKPPPRNIIHLTDIN